MQIRPETPADHAAIRKVTLAAFENMPHSQQTEAAIIDALRAADALTLSLVAEQDGQIIGHVAFSPVLIDDQDHNWLGLGPVSVHPDHQAHGIGSKLIRTALDQITAMGTNGCVLLGEPAYYARFGFRAAPAEGPALVYPGVPAEYFQSLPLNGPALSGTVTYHPAFAAS
ncbi:GNAT family N-acetyltransferase [Brevundimonas sp.]|uniref:GNAT family N-acetyltransferase n=1 Tax=Brevundimonas sp. TaxID=1871086 RepID=UPI002FC9B8A6